MKRITTFCLVVGLMIACTDDDSVKKDQTPVDGEWAPIPAVIMVIM